MKFSSLTDRITTLSGDDPWRVHTLACQRRDKGEDIIMLSIGEEVHEQTDKRIVDAAVESLRAGRHHYTDVRGIEALRQIITTQHRTRTGQVISSDQCTVYSGAQNSLFAVAQCLLESGDEVILPEPYYTTYPGTFTATGARAKSVLGDAQRFYLPSVAQLQDAVSPDTRMIVITQPGNPMGTAYTQTELDELVEFCVAREIWLVSDEVYALLVEPGQRASAASSSRADSCCITVSSLSKSHRMTGWRLGWVCAPPELSEHLERLSTAMHYGLPAFVMDAAIEALGDEGETADKIRESMRKRRAVCNETLKNLSPVELIDSGTGMFVILDFGKTPVLADDFAEGLLSREGVSVLPCSGFGEAGKQLIRIGLCVDEEELGLACEKIDRYARSVLT